MDYRAAIMVPRGFRTAQLQIQNSLLAKKYRVFNDILSFFVKFTCVIYRLSTYIHSYLPTYIQTCIHT